MTKVTRTAAHCCIPTLGGSAKHSELHNKWLLSQNWMGHIKIKGQSPAYPESTPRTRLSTKKDPMMMRGMKYSQFQVAPKASLVCKKKHSLLKSASHWGKPGAFLPLIQGQAQFGASVQVQ